MSFLRNKTRLKSLLAGYERNCIRVIADGLVHNRARRQILKDLKGELQKYRKICGLDDNEAHTMWNGSYRILYSTAKKTWGKKTPEEIYAVLRKDLIYSGKFNYVKNLVANRHEEVEKHDWIRNLLSESGTPFYICDCHKNCARGHLAYQGKIYYDTDYNIRYSGSLRDRITDYIKDSGILSVQEAVGEGIWLMTRPNCRHRFHPVPLEDVLHGKKIDAMTVSVPEGRGYEYLEMEFYYERTRILEELQDVLPCSELEKDLSNSRKLVRKWYKKNQRV